MCQIGGPPEQLTPNLGDFGGSCTKIDQLLTKWHELMRHRRNTLSGAGGDLASPSDGGADAEGSMKITAVTCIKNEGPFLLEWIAYNRLIGVTDFLIYSNDCADGSDRLLDALAERGVVHHRPNPAKGRSLQMEARQ